MKKLVKPSFWPKLFIGLLLFLQIVVLIGLLFWLLSVVTDGTLSSSYILFFVILIYAFNSVLGIYIINSDSPYAYKVAWLFVVFALPVGGALLYIFLANKTDSALKRRQVRKWTYPIVENKTIPETHAKLREAAPFAVSTSDYLNLVGGFGTHQRTSVEYFPLVDFAHEPILRELKKAKHYIFLEFFIVEPGVFWDSILAILEEKAKEGLDVRLLYDDVGSLGTMPSGYAAKLRKSGIKCEPYNHFRPFLDIRQNNRDHRKILVIDGHTAFSGGFNLADEYVNKVERFGHWKDNAILLKGEAVYSFTLLFLSVWIANGHHEEKIDKAYYSPDTFIEEAGGYPESTGFVQPYGDLPFDKEEFGESTYLNLIQHAKDYCYITTPYLIIDCEMENALCRAAKSGVDVRLITPHIPDKKAVFNITRSYYGKLLKSGVKVYEYTPGFVHEKTFCVDDRMATVGTINLDYRSLYLHLECGTFMVDMPAIKNIKRDFEDSFPVCHEVTLEEWNRWRVRNRGYWSILRIIDPML